MSKTELRIVKDGNFWRSRQNPGIRDEVALACHGAMKGLFDRFGRAQEGDEAILILEPATDPGDRDPYRYSGHLCTRHDYRLVLRGRDDGIAFSGPVLWGLAEQLKPHQDRSVVSEVLVSADTFF